MQRRSSRRSPERAAEGQKQRGKNSKDHSEKKDEQTKDTTDDMSMCSSTQLSPKKRARRSDLTFERIQPTFTLPIKAAASTLDTSVNTLKRAARSHGIPSWPSRDITGLQSTINQVQLSLAGPQDGAERKRLSALLRSLQDHIESLRESGQPPSAPK